MVKAILLPSEFSEFFKPVTYQLPVGMLPVVNKPLMEHQIELFVRYGVRQIRMSCNHLSNRVEEYFSNGARWGANISYNFERPPFSPLSALRQMRPYFQGDTLIVMHSDVVADIDIQAALQHHWTTNADATFICAPGSRPLPGTRLTLNEQGRIRSVVSGPGPNGSPSHVECGIFIIEPDILELLSDTLGHSFLQATWLAAQRATLHLVGYQTEEPIVRISDWNTFYQVQKDILEGSFSGLHIPGIQVKRGVWMGKNVSTSSSATFEGPVMIGDNCRIAKGVTLGKGTILGHDVMVDVGASMEESMVLSRTFVGPQMSLQNSIILGNLVIDLKKNAVIAFKDNLSALEIQQKRYSNTLYNVINRSIAVVLSVLLLPVSVSILAFLVLAFKFPLVSRVKRIGVDLHHLAAGKLRLRVFDLFFFGPVEEVQDQAGYNPRPVTTLPRIFSCLANIFNVAKGDLLFVGNRPMDPEGAFSLKEEWQRTRFKCQTGLVSVLDTSEVDGMSDGEMAIAEGYYAVNRNVGMDLAILMKAGAAYLRKFVKPASKTHPSSQSI